MTAAVSDVPLVPSQPQRVALALSGVGYQIKLTWCVPSECWVMDLRDQSGNPLACGIPLVTGSGLLEQLAYLGVRGELLVQTDNDADAVPTFANLGTLSHLFYVVPG